MVLKQNGEQNNLRACLIILKSRDNFCHLWEKLNKLSEKKLLVCNFLSENKCSSYSEWIPKMSWTTPNNFGYFQWICKYGAPYEPLISCREGYVSQNKLIIVYGFMNSLLNLCNYNCKHCSSNSSLQNLHLIFMNLLLDINIIVSIAQKNLPFKIYMKMALHLYEWICF